MILSSNRFLIALWIFYNYYKDSEWPHKGKESVIETQFKVSESHHHHVCQIWHFNLLRNNLKVPFHEREGEHVLHIKSMCVCVCVCGRKGETDRQIERARPDGMPYIANNWEARGPIMHTERVFFINYPTGLSPSLLYAHKDTFLHFIIFVGGGCSLYPRMNKYPLCVHC